MRRPSRIINAGQIHYLADSRGEPRGPNEDSVAYVVSSGGDRVEAWPRTTSLVGCD